MDQIARFLCILSLTCATYINNAFSLQKQFIHNDNKDGWVLNDTEITYHVDNQEIGFIAYTKAPLCYIIHSFYVYPQYRKNGLGKELLAHTIDFLKKNGAQRIYIQPGPFEVVDSTYQEIHNPEERQQKIKLLIEFYKNMGFCFAAHFTAICARLMYNIMNIDQDATYLMVMTL